MRELLFIAFTVLISSALYAYLHKKTRISLKYLYQDNLAVIIPVAAIAIWFLSIEVNYIVVGIAILILSPGLAFTYTMIRFWRTPCRKIRAKEQEIVSPADGKVIYIHKISANDVPVSVKKGRSFQLNELTKTTILEKPCWLIGINMTPFDVHKNCAPIEGKIILNAHFKGKFLSLKDAEALADNERNTYVIENDRLRVGVVQIASRLVRRIDSYVKEGQQVKKGDWLGMIRFGSQVDIILPIDAKIYPEVGQQVYAGQTIIAEL